MMQFKPMLADPVDLKKLRYPVVASPKLDGVRATFQHGSLVTRSLKPLPNPYINYAFQYEYPLDGELIVGDPTAADVFRQTMKVVTSHTADCTGVRFFVFDLVSTEVEFVERLQLAHNSMPQSPFYVPVPHIMVGSELDLLKYEDRILQEGYEGVMLRDPNGFYKMGRSTTNEGLLLKMKRKETSEAKVVGFEEQMKNGNVLVYDRLGYAERSSHQKNMIPKGTMGALIVEDIKTGVQFNVGTGYNDAERQAIWDRQDAYMGKIMTYEFLPVGVKDKPRHPAFKGWRDKVDMS